MDLDYEELEATRRLNRVVIESNSIQIIQDFINEIKDFELNKDVVEIVNALEDILEEREADKKRIKELEEALLKVKDKNATLFITCRNSIPKQKVKEIILKIINYKIPRAVNNGYYYDYFVNQEYKEDFVKLFNKLLEDK